MLAWGGTGLLGELNSGAMLLFSAGVPTLWTALPLTDAGADHNQNLTNAFTYAIRDLPPSGLAPLTVAGRVVILVAWPGRPTFNIVSADLAPDDNTRIVFAGIPGQTYLVLRATSLTPQ